MLSDIWESVSDIPSKIINGLKEFFTDLKNAILEIPITIGNFIKDLFVPDSDYIEQSFNNFVDELKHKFNFDTSSFESLFSNEKPVDDIKGEYTITGVGTIKTKFMDTKYLVNGVQYFRPFIRGFIVLLLLIYNVRQLIGFFGFHSGASAERVSIERS